MKHLIAILILVFSVNQQIFSQTGEKNFIDQPYIEVSGKVETEIIPNEIYLKITLNENDKKGKLRIEKQENQMLSALKTLGVDIKEDLSVIDFDGYYKRKFLADSKVIKIKNYELLVRDGKTLSEVYYELDKIDISNITIIRVSHSDMETIKRDTKLKALKVAKQKASDYAMAIDQAIGNALFIQESNNINYASNAIYGLRANTNYIDKKLREAEFENLQIRKIVLSETVIAKFILK